MSETATNAATIGDNYSEKENIDPNLAPIALQNLSPQKQKSMSPQKPLATTLLNSIPSQFTNSLPTDPAFADFVSLHAKLKDHFESDSKQIPKYNWDLLSLVFEHIYKLYNDEVAALLKQLDALDIKRSIWHESAFRIDTERATRRFKKIESWISNEDLYLTKTKKDLSSSVQIIRNTLQKLNNSDSTSTP